MDWKTQYCSAVGDLYIQFQANQYPSRTSFYKLVISNSNTYTEMQRNQQKVEN
jgi:hypothetical protein